MYGHRYPSHSPATPSAPRRPIARHGLTLHLQDGSTVTGLVRVGSTVVTRDELLHWAANLPADLFAGTTITVDEQPIDITTITAIG